MALDIDPGSGFDVTLHCSQYSTIKNKTMTLRNRAFLSELLGKLQQLYKINETRKNRFGLYY